MHIFSSVETKHIFYNTCGKKEPQSEMINEYTSYVPLNHISYLAPRRERNMLKRICTALMKTRRCFVEMNLKLTACTSGQIFQDPCIAEKRSLLILFPITEKLSPAASPR
mmetsp:Transcript_6371/g.7145  ORF Transcript_6371/g.7145 Transcript_6371/m.7145 type:complete len:110 (-) Transcript_6371:745-1074(-)